MKYMSHWGQLFFYVLVAVFSLFFLSIVMFFVQAKKYYLNFKEIYFLLSVIFKNKLNYVRFFHKKDNLLQVIGVVSLKEDRVDLLERLYSIYVLLEQKENTTKLIKKNNVSYRNTEALFIGMMLTLELASGERKNAKLLGVEKSGLQVRLLDDIAEYSERINVYFWEYGSGYRFVSKILKSKGFHLEIAHSRQIQLYLRRSYRRVRVEEPAQFFLFGLQDSIGYDLEHGSGFDCVVRDISEGGAAIIAEGRGQVGLRIKLQFRLGERDVVMCGTIKDVYYDHDYNQSRLHLQVDKEMPFKMKERILSYIYNI